MLLLARAPTDLGSAYVFTRTIDVVFNKHEGSEAMRRSHLLYAR